MALQTLPELTDVAIQKYQKRTFCIERTQFRRFTWSYEDLDHAAIQVEHLLHRYGLNKGDRVGICAPNGPWWLAIFIACSRRGFPIVPLDVNSSADFIRSVSHATTLKVLFKTVYKPVELPKNIDVVRIEDMPRLVKNIPTGRLDVAVLNPEDTLEIVFTSGSTGDPKGVVLTHGNLTSNLQALLNVWPIGSKHILLSMIPLSHMYEQTVGFLVPFVSASKVIYMQTLRPYQLVQALQSENVTTIVTVPAFLSLLRRRILEKAEDDHYGRFLNVSLQIAQILPFIVRRYMFQSIYLKLGPSLRLMAVGGAPLPVSLENFWKGLGVHITYGYGLTETSPIATYSTPKANKRGSTGRCLPGQNLHISQDGEIWLRGPNVFSSYYNNPEVTAKVLRDGWFHTGDIGHLDKDGYLYITGRKKNMLLSESGLNIYPEDIESQLLEYSEIRDVVVMLKNDGTSEVLTAVVLTNKSYEHIHQLVAELNTRLASHQTIADIVVWPEADFPRTPTRKVKRQMVIDTVNAQTRNSLSLKTELSQSSTDPLVGLVARIAAVSPNTINDTTNLVSDLGLDSLKRLELVSSIEEELGSFISESAINASTTMAGLSDLAAKAAHSPKANIWHLSIFESPTFSAARVCLELPLLMFSAYFQKLQSSGECDSCEPVVYIANHTSHLDTTTFLRLVPIRRRRKILIAAAKDYFFSNPIKACLLRCFLPLIPLDRTGNVQATLQRMGTYLDQGYSILVFPEGGRSKNGRLQTFKAGIGVIAQELGVAVVPLYFKGNHSILPKGRRWPKRGKVTATIGQPVSFTKESSYQYVTEQLEKKVKDLCE